MVGDMSVEVTRRCNCKCKIYGDCRGREQVYIGICLKESTGQEQTLTLNRLCRGDDTVSTDCFEHSYSVYSTLTA